jgi:hypothetical protein
MGKEKRAWCFIPQFNALKIISSVRELHALWIINFTRGEKQEGFEAVAISSRGST